MNRSYYNLISLGIAIVLAVSFFPAELCAKSRETVLRSGQSESTLMEYDRGSKRGERKYTSVSRCVELPCVVTQHGAWRFSDEVMSKYAVSIGYMHEGSYRPIGLFQQSTTLEQKLGERLLNRYPNRKIVNLTRLVEMGKTNSIYIYGIRLQYDIDEGDPFVVRLTNRDNPSDVNEYYFRYHQTGTKVDLDLAFLFPINVFYPNTNSTIRGADGGVAFSLSLARSMDPDRQYNWFSKLARAVRLNVFTGIVNWRTVTSIAGDRIVQDKADGFGGIGFTFFDFIIAGYGVNFVRTPHSSFPFVGLEVKHAFEFIRSLKKDSHSQWEKYLKSEKNRAIVESISE